MQNILKKNLIVGLVAFAALSAHANITQNAFNFGNGGATGPVYFDTVGIFGGAGTPVDSTVSAQFFFGNSNSRAALTEFSPIYNFTTGGLGVINGGPFTVTSAVVIGGTAGFYQMRAWTGGSSYDNATGKKGESAITAITFGGLTSGGSSLPPGDLGLHAPFAITTAVVPEPATLALGLFGAAGLLFRRRK